MQIKLNNTELCSNIGKYLNVCPFCCWNIDDIEVIEVNLMFVEFYPWKMFKESLVFLLPNNGITIIELYSTYWFWSIEWILSIMWSFWNFHIAGSASMKVLILAFTWTFSMAKQLLSQETRHKRTNMG